MLQDSSSRCFRLGPRLIRTAAILGSISALTYYTHHLVTAESVPDQSIIPARPDSYDPLIDNLRNRQPHFIDAPNIENLISLPRHKLALFSAKQLSRAYTPAAFQRLVDELSKLNLDASSPINDAFIHQIGHVVLSEELQFKLALRGLRIDNKLFRSEPPSTYSKIAMLSARDRITEEDEDETQNSQDDAEYALIFEFFQNYVPDLAKKHTKKNSPGIRSLIDRISSEINSLLLSDTYRLDRQSADSFQDNVHEPQIAVPNSVMLSLRQQLKKEFVERNEWLIMTLVEKWAKRDISEFVLGNGLELLVLLYEKHKHDPDYLIAIGNCLCLASIDVSNRSLFIQSGWLKRLHRMYSTPTSTHCQLSDESGNCIDIMRELISFKILFNLNQPKDSCHCYYSTVVYPLNTNSCIDDLEPTGNMGHKHAVDVIFVHGLRGSLFRTWRQDRNKVGKDSAELPGLDDLATLEERIIEKLNSLIDEVGPVIHRRASFSYCWPKDWLGPDLNRKVSDTNFRLLGVNYNSLFSDWEQEKFDDKKLKLGIKERAIDVLEQLRQAGVGERPIIWVSHSMGGLIVKQLLVHLHEVETELKKKKTQVDNGTLKSVGNLVENTKSIVFLSTPHLGSAVAKRMKDFRFVSYPSDETVELASNSSYLVDLNKNFLELVKTRCNWYRILSICENKPTFYFANIFVRTVTEESARLGIGEFYIAEDKDHLNVCKPASRYCVIYRKITDLITGVIEKENFGREEYEEEKRLLTWRKEKKLFEMFKQFDNF